MAQSKEFEVALALSRFGLGASAHGWRYVGDDARGLLRKEILQGSSALRVTPELPSTPAILTEYTDYQKTLADFRKRGAPNDGSLPVNVIGERNLAEINARLNIMAHKPKIGFNERLVMFWANHFAVATDKSSQIRAMAGSYEREAIRPHIFGRFTDMVMAVETHPCMLNYLDNITSIGPQSLRNKHGKYGLNENLAREIMELHIMGVGSGYTQADVTAFAAALTGWTVSKMPETSKDIGDGFDFIETNHQPGEQEVLGKVYPDSGFFQAADIIIDLTGRPATAHHIAFKLAKHFVADTPPPALVDHLSDTFIKTGGDLSAVYMALIDSDASWSPDCVKIRSPQEQLIAMLRATGITIRPTLLKQVLFNMGQLLWTPSGPNGFPDTFAAWSTPEGLTTRVDTAAVVAAQATSGSAHPNLDPRALVVNILGPRLSNTTAAAVNHAESISQGLVLTFMSPEFLRR